MVKPLKHYANLHKNLVDVTSLTNRSYDNENTSRHHLYVAANFTHLQ